MMNSPTTPHHPDCPAGDTNCACEIARERDRYKTFLEEILGAQFLENRTETYEKIRKMLGEVQEPGGLKHAVEQFADELLREGQRSHQRERDPRMAKSLRVIGRCLRRVIQIVEGRSPLPYLGTRFFMGMFAEMDAPGEESTE